MGHAPHFPLPTFQSRVVPVIVIHHADLAVPLARALLKGGIDVMEITLRHAAGLAAIEQVARAVPEMCVGAGTVTRAHEFAQVKACGAQFALSPGLTQELVQAARDAQLPYLPGVMTPSEALQAQAWGHTLLKLFPAAQAGGLGLLKAMAGPLSDVRFCPTGGISPANLVAHLQQANVALVGGSWITPLDWIEQQRWDDITRLALEATQLAHSAHAV